MKKILSIVILLISFTSLSQNFTHSDIELIKDSPYTLNISGKTTNYQYKGYSGSCGIGNATLDYLLNDYSFFRGTLRLNNATYTITGNYQGEGTYAGAIYDDSRDPVGTITWEQNTNPTVINVIISSPDRKFRFNMFKYTNFKN